MIQRTLLYATVRKVFSPYVAQLYPACSLCTKPEVASAVSTCRTSESNPVNHQDIHEARYYTIPPDIHQQLFCFGGIPWPYKDQITTFNESCLMVRRPALEIIKYLKATNFSHPVIHYVIYGREGTGKTLTMAHLVHYAYKDNWMIVHMPNVARLSRSEIQVTSSTSKPGKVDHPFDALKFLQRFKSQNGTLMKDLDLQTQEEYVWSKREVTEKGSPLNALIDQGINRSIYACDVVDALLKEVKAFSNAGRVKTMVLIDNMNSFFYNRTRFKREDKSMVLPRDFTLIEAFINFTKKDWKNGAIIMTVSTKAVGNDRRESHQPRYLLGKEGFEHSDPFVPILTENYSEKEIESCLDYYTECMWLQHENTRTELGRKEIVFLSGTNPFRLMNICASL